MRYVANTDDRIPPKEAVTRFLGVTLLVAVGYVHLLDLGHKLEEGIWYMALAFVSLVAATVVLAVALVRASDSVVRLVWLGAALVSVGALGGYGVSRLFPLPGMADHQGDWISTYGALAALVETTLVALAAYAMRDLTRRGVPHRPPPWPRLPAAALAPSAVMLVALTALPARALAHGGEDEAAGEGGAPAGRGSEEGGQADGISSEGSAAHADPFLGTTELGLALLASLALLLWAGRSLRDRVELEPA